MGAFSELSVGGKEVMAWKYEVPRDPFLSFVFTEEDRVIRPVSPPPEEWDEDYEPHEILYVADVRTVLQRLHSLGLSSADIDRTIAGHLGIAEDKVPLVLLDDDEFFDKYPSPDDPDGEAEWDKLAEEHDTLRARAEHAGLGGLAIIRQLHNALAEAKPEALVQLTFEEIIEWAPAVELEKISLFKNHDVELLIEHRYLTLARIHFSEHNFNLAFIDLAVALELVTKEMLRRTCEARRLDADVEKLFRKLGMMDALLFGSKMLLELDVDAVLIDRVREVYNKRNNVVHQGARRFSMAETARAIQDVEELIELLKSALEQQDAVVVEQVAPADPPVAGG